MIVDSYDVDTVYNVLFDGIGEHTQTCLDDDPEILAITTALYWIRVNPDSPRFTFYVILGEDVRQLPDDWNVNHARLSRSAVSSSTEISKHDKIRDSIGTDVHSARILNSAGMVFYSPHRRYCIIGLKRSLHQCARSVARMVSDKTDVVTSEWCALWTYRHLEQLLELPESLEKAYSRPRPLLPSVTWLEYLNADLSRRDDGDGV
jgi:hypothetical protein